jgi:hypothetical protein
VDIKKIFAQKTARLRGFLMPGSLDFKSAKTWMAKRLFGFPAGSELSQQPNRTK